MNAKELKLAKLNAGTKTLGLYVYGVSIGMKFNDIANIMMSPVGEVINNVLNGNAFTRTSGYNRVDESLFNYFNNIPWGVINSYPANVVKSFLQVFKANYKGDFKDSFMQFCKSNDDPLSKKLNFIETLRKKHNLGEISDIRKYNELIDFIEEYAQLLDIILNNINTFNDIITLSLGAEEMRTLGQVLGLNKGLKNKSGEFLNSVNNITRLIYNKTGNLEDIINLLKFAFDEMYREECIEKYERVKHSFNILDIVAKVPHYLGYVQTLATADAELSQSYKYRACRENSLKIATILNPKSIKVYGEDKIIKGILNYIGDQLRKTWMRNQDLTIVIPKGNKIYDKSGNFKILEESVPVKLGTDWGDITFKEWFEHQVIPDLKAGIIKPGVQFVGTINNKFILDLGNSLFTHTISRNPIINASLPINMLPRTDSDRTIFNQYKSEFNKLKWSYEWNTEHYDGNGSSITESNSLPIIDMFTYYAMIANGWKLGEKSLVPILEDFLNVGIIKSFHDYIAEMDRSGEVWDVSKTNWTHVAPYVVPFTNPYVAKTEYIQYREADTKRYVMAEKEHKNEDFTNDDLIMDLSEELPERMEHSNIRGYAPINTGVSISQTGFIEDYGQLVIPYEDSKLILQYDLETNLVVKLIDNMGLSESDIANILEKLKDTSYYVCKEAGSQRKLFNTLIISDIINNELNPCSA